MKLRPRLVLTIVVVAVPLVAGGFWLRADVERRATVASLAQTARARMETGGREQCEASPETFQDPPSWPGRGSPGRGTPGGPTQTPPGEGVRGEQGSGDRSRPTIRGPRFEMFAYGPDFVSLNPRAPRFPEQLRTALEAGEPEAGTVTDEEERREVKAAVRMDWSSGPCAIMLAWRHDEKPAVRPAAELGYAACILLGVVVTLFLAVGPVERRLRRLASRVRLSAVAHYRAEVPVEGRDEVAELARAFNAASFEVRAHIEELKKREGSLRSFVENTTHDVMLPLTVLQGHLSQMRDAIEGGAAPSRQTVREALEELQYMSSLVANLVAAAKLEAGQPEPRRDAFSWNELVERVVLRHATIAREKEVELDFAVPEDDVKAEGDVTLVEQALSNVVHNAVQYNHAGGHVAVVVDAADERFSVRVFDDGPGVDGVELERLSERSFRSDAARARHPDGMGLGLSIAKDVADRLGFDLELRKSEAGGLEVELRGPVAANGAPVL